MGPPVFVVGCPRSGTTLVRRMLNAHPNLSVGPETLFLSVLQNIEKQRWHQLSQFGITQAQWQSHIRELFSWVHSQRAEREGKARWVDKTPGYAVILDYVDQLYPDCQVIHLLRDPHDVVDSWRRRVGPVKAREAVKAWPQHVRAAHVFRDKHSPERFTEIRYEDLVASPKDVMSDLIAWLGEPWDEAILDLPRSSKSDEPGAEALQKRWKKWLGSPEDEKDIGKAPPPPWKRDERTRSSTQISTSSVGVGKRGSNRIRNAPYFLELDLICRDLMRELGYA